ncbi:MAG: 16S rRNA (uracil(1498)-N(3))-methyltransferase [Bacteroidales bacterium]|nr:16S rRNA (uracil(1498)-N(3))-methyltransferase [Bacteroidales bacterium]
MDIFYKSDITSNQLVLDPGESNHCIKVMRYKKGDAISLIDGKGGYFTAEIEEEDRKACRIKIISKKENYEKLPYELHIAIAPTKSMDRFEWFVEKATEIGITSITPVLCNRSERRNLRIDRLEKVAVAAIKQSVRAYLPEIREMVSFNDWIAEEREGSRLIAHCMDGQKNDLRKVELSGINTIVIGPEGDFTPEEVARAADGCFEPITLGAYRLRTETAGIVACSVIYQRLGQ